MQNRYCIRCCHLLASLNSTSGPHPSLVLLGGWGGLGRCRSWGDMGRGDDAVGFAGSNRGEFLMTVHLQANFPSCTSRVAWFGIWRASAHGRGHHTKL